MSFVSTTRTRGVPATSVSYIDATLAVRIDEVLMQEPGFSLDQLMELAGLAVAEAAVDYINGGGEGGGDFSFKAKKSKDVLVLCGPGNNGGDGLVAARHLKNSGFVPVVVYPRPRKDALFVNLVQQLGDLGVPVVDALPLGYKGYGGGTGVGEGVEVGVGVEGALKEWVLVIDAVFGFSFKGPMREPYASLLSSVTSGPIAPPILSVDIPSGWNVEHGDVDATGFSPAAVISLTVPKLCMLTYRGSHHYVGGRFVPPTVASTLGLLLPDYGDTTTQIVRLSTATCATATGIQSYCAIYPKIIINHYASTNYTTILVTLTLRSVYIRLETQGNHGRFPQDFICHNYSVPRQPTRPP